MISKHDTFVSRLVDLFLPRTCHVCGYRLAPAEEEVCLACRFSMPRTRYWLTPMDNPMVSMYLGIIPIQRAAAMYFYKRQGDTSRMIFAIKYYDYPNVGITMGRTMAQTMGSKGFFDGIDMIVPVPLSRKRERDRGYNQSAVIAEGIAQVTSIPVRTDVVARIDFVQSQTTLSRIERMDNVTEVFECLKPDELKGKHILIVDDVITTGSTTIELAKVLCSDPSTVVSIASLCLAGKHF